MNKQLESLLTPVEAATRLKVSLSFLAKARVTGEGPRYRKLGRTVRYSEGDLLAFLKSRTRTSTCEP